MGAEPVEFESEPLQFETVVKPNAEIMVKVKPQSPAVTCSSTICIKRPRAHSSSNSLSWLLRRLPLAVSAQNQLYRIACPGDVTIARTFCEGSPRSKSHRDVWCRRRDFFSP